MYPTDPYRGLKTEAMKFFSKECTKSSFKIKCFVMERRRSLNGTAERKFSDTLGTGLQEKTCSLTEGTNSPRSVECRLRVTSFTSQCEKRAIVQNKG